jgi:hypothetical protein
MRAYIAFTLICVSANCHCQFNDLRSRSYIIWSDSISLSIDDFQSQIRPDFTTESGSTDSFRAMAQCKIQAIIEESDDKVEVEIYAAFIKKGSWFDKENVDSTRYSHLLNHEKGHFDLTEVVARRIRSGIDSLNALDCSKIEKYENLINNSAKTLDDLQKRYDDETYNGMIVHKQEEWNKRIADLLSHLSKYSSNIYD